MGSAPAPALATGFSYGGVRTCVLEGAGGGAGRGGERHKSIGLHDCPALPQLGGELARARLPRARAVFSNRRCRDGFNFNDPLSSPPCWARLGPVDPSYGDGVDVESGRVKKVHRYLSYLNSHQVMWYHFLHQGKNLCQNPFSH